MKGYYTNGSYFGYLPSVKKYIQFESEMAYREYFTECEG